MSRSERTGSDLSSNVRSGIAGSTAVSLVGGSLADLWSNEERGKPMSMFAFSAFASTGLGPVIFSYAAQESGFRIIMWIMFGVSSLFAILITCFIQETRASVLLSRRAAKLRLETGDERYQPRIDSPKTSVAVNLTRPLRMLITEPVLTAFTIWISFAWGILYILLDSIPIMQVHDLLF